MTEVATSWSEDRIYDEIKHIFVEHFEIDEAEVTLEASLYDDLDIDSIDAVDLMAALKQKTGLKLDPEAFKEVRTVGNVVDSLVSLINENQ